jgi:hypothetical protein
MAAITAVKTGGNSGIADSSGDSGYEMARPSLVEVNGPCDRALVN